MLPGKLYKINKVQAIKLNKTTTKNEIKMKKIKSKLFRNVFFFNLWKLPNYKMKTENIKINILLVRNCLKKLEKTRKL